MDVGSLMQLLGGQQAPMKGGTPPQPQGQPGMISAWQQAQAQGLGNNAPTGMQTGVPPQQGNVNPLAQMLAQQGPQYKPGDTTWGQAGDRLLRYTPQEGNQRGGGGTGGGGAGGLPPINPGEDSMAYMLRIGMSQADADAALAMSKANPNLTFQQIMAQMHGGGGGGGGGTQVGGVLPGSVSNGVNTNINLGQLGAKVGPDGVPVPVTPPNPTGAPSINDAMKKIGQDLGPGVTLPTTGSSAYMNALAKVGPRSDPNGPMPSQESLMARASALQKLERIAQGEKPERSASRAEKDAWYQNWLAVNNAYIQAQKDTGLSAGAPTWVGQGINQ
jgi:hypothetical protein